MFRTLILQVIAGILGLWLACEIIPKVEFAGSIKYLILAGLFLGTINTFIKPIIKFITLPLRILTLGLFTLVINMVILRTVDIVSPQITISGIIPLILTTFIVGTLSFFLRFFYKK
ncbi:MAG: phage holin family protein [Patescibacteria group bacterium]|nr:phage holin family protein [Patescibacteria group bacterium]